MNIRHCPYCRAKKVKQYSTYFRCKSCRAKFNKPDYRRMVDEAEGKRILLPV